MCLFRLVLFLLFSFLYGPSILTELMGVLKYFALMILRIINAGIFVNVLPGGCMWRQHHHYNGHEWLLDLFPAG